MQKKTKIGLVCLAVLLVGMFTFTGYDSFSYEDTSLRTLLTDTRQLRLKEVPAQITADDLSERGVSCVQITDNNYLIEGEFVSFSIYGKQSAYRAVMSLRDLLELSENSELRYSKVLSGFGGIWAKLAGVNSYVFYQYYNGLPVLNSYVLVIAERFGKPSQLDAVVYSDFPDDLPTEPQITADEAIRAAALHEMNEPLKDQPPFPVIAVDQEHHAALAWLVMIGEKPVAVDAVSGAVLDIGYDDMYD